MYGSCIPPVLCILFWKLPVENASDESAKNQHRWHVTTTGASCYSSVAATAAALLRRNTVLDTGPGESSSVKKGVVNIFSTYKYGSISYC